MMTKEETKREVEIYNSISKRRYQLFEDTTKAIYRLLEIAGVTEVDLPHDEHLIIEDGCIHIYDANGDYQCPGEIDTDDLIDYLEDVLWVVGYHEEKSTEGIA